MRSKIIRYEPRTQAHEKTGRRRVAITIKKNKTKVIRKNGGKLFKFSLRKMLQMCFITVEKFKGGFSDHALSLKVHSTRF